MGTSPSSSTTPSHTYDQVYLPADAFRLCHAGASCFCRGAHPHNRSKYVYVDRSSNHHHNSHNNNNNNGNYPFYGGGAHQGASPREVFRDPMDCLERGLVPPGWGMAPARAWGRRDWDVMDRLVEQFLGRNGGEEILWAEMMFRNGGGALGMQGYGGGGGAGPMGFHQQPSPSAWGVVPAPMPWQGVGYHNGGGYGGNGNGNMNPWQGGGGVGGGGLEFTTAGKRDTPIPSPADDPRFSGIDEKLRILTDIMFGSEAERQEKQVQEQLLKRFQPMIPELAKLIALQQQQQQQAGVGGAGAAGGLPGMGGGGAGMNPFAAGPAGMMPPPGTGIGMGMGGPMMNPYAAMGGGMGPMMSGGGGGDPGMMGGGGGDMGGGPARRRNRGGRRPVRDYDYENDVEEDYGGFGSRNRGNRRRRRGGGGGRMGRDDDPFDDWGGDDHSRRGPPKGPRRPRPGNGGGGGRDGGGSTGEGGGGTEFDTFNDNPRFRSAPAHVAQPSHWASPPRETAPQPQPPPQPPQPLPMTTGPLNRALTPIQEGSQGSPPPRIIRPFGAIPIPQGGAPPYRPFDGSTYDMPNSPIYHPGVPVSDFAGERRIPRGDFDFRSEADLARPRVEDKKRGEPDAGGPVRRPDAL